MSITKKETLEGMTIQDLSCYYDVIKQQIDNCLIRLRMPLSNGELTRINERRLKYNQIYEAIQEELNKRILNIVIK